jgi:hypothetical protein
MSEAPPEGDLKFALEQFGSDAKKWREAAGVLSGAAGAADGLALRAPDFGVAFAVHSAYAEVQQLIVALLRGGVTSANTIADNLITARDTYQREEDANVHKIKGVW